MNWGSVYQEVKSKFPKATPHTSTAPTLSVCSVCAHGAARKHRTFGGWGEELRSAHSPKDSTCSLASSGLTSPDTVASDVKDVDAESVETPEDAQKTKEPEAAPKKALDENANKQNQKSEAENTVGQVAGSTVQKKAGSKSSSSSESSRESDDTVVSVDGSGSECKSPSNEDRPGVANGNDAGASGKKDRPAAPKSGLQLQIAPSPQNMSRLSPITEARESLLTTPVTPLDKPKLAPEDRDATSKANLHVEVPQKTRLAMVDQGSPALPRTPSNTPDLPRKQLAASDSTSKLPHSPPASDFSGYDELSPPFSPPNEPSTSRTHVPKSRKANLRGKWTQCELDFQVDHQPLEP